MKVPILVSEKSLPYHTCDEKYSYGVGSPSYYESLMHHAVAGFRVPALPVLSTDSASRYTEHLLFLRRRFLSLLQALHDPTQLISIGMTVIGYPERSVLDAAVELYLLCGVVNKRRSTTIQAVHDLATQLYRLYPSGGFPNYSQPLGLTEQELAEALFQDSRQQVNCVEFCKYSEPAPHDFPQERYIQIASLDRIPHVHWSDSRTEPWLTIVDLLAKQEAKTGVSIVLSPTSLVEFELASSLAQQYEIIIADGLQRRDMRVQVGQMPPEAEQRSLLQKLALADIYRAQGLTSFHVSRARRGAYAYNQLIALQDQLFSMRVSIITEGRRIPPELIQAVRAALSSPAEDEPDSNLGWLRPEVVQPEGAEMEYALNNNSWLGQYYWPESVQGYTDPEGRRLRYLVTAREAVGLFRIPLFPPEGLTTSFRVGNVPFSIPSEVVSTKRFKPDESLLSFGYLYQRDHYLSPENVGGEKALAFQLPLSDLEKPSLLVGAPGSGKSNLALYLLVQLWQDHRVPFLVLDPSTGHEYRYLFGHKSLADELLVYTVGDQDGLPFRFNPFEVPPGVTVQGHITRLLGCFKAAYEMWDPLPAIYEAALTRVFQQPPYNWQMSDKGGCGKSPPCLGDFAQAVIDELEEKVLPDYGKGTEASGILTGASKIRVNSILKSRWDILNVRYTNPDFFQELLKRPVVIELGALGDPSSIALVMAFLVTQIAGHIEYAYPYRQQVDKPHLLLIEEAHRLLSTENTSTSSSSQGNVRGKSAEEMNMLLAEVRKFRQGIMVLDQRPSSLIGGVLDNALINIMCRLNDRQGFGHLAHVLNLNQSQQQYARTRLKAGDAILLDANSGQPVLTRADNIIDDFKKSVPATGAQQKQMWTNANQANLLPPQAEPPSRKNDAVSASEVTVEWKILQEHFDEHFVEKVHSAVQDRNWLEARRIIRNWAIVHRPTINFLVEQTLLDFILETLVVEGADKESLLLEFQQVPPKD